MFSSIFLGRLTKLYPYPYSKIKFLLPFNCKSSLRGYAMKKVPPMSQGKKAPLKSLKNDLTSKVSKVPRDKNKAFVTRNFPKELGNATINPSVGIKPMGIGSKSLPNKLSSFEGLKEFFSHPLTWDRNNGYLNILLALAIFGYSFCSTCGGEGGSTEHRGK